MSLLVLCLLLALVVCGGISVDDINIGLFTADLIAEKCTSNDAACIETWKDLGTSTKISTIYRTIDRVNSAISEALKNDSWKLEEGGSYGYHKKSILLSLLADDKRVKTICEIGFNSGHSAVNFLISNPTASLISFDFFDYAYSPIAVDAVSHLLFPNLSIFLVPGDTVLSIPKFINSLSMTQSVYHSRTSDPLKSQEETLASYPLCNLIFIDGGHTKEVARSDLINMRRLADPAFHVVVVDDYDLEGIKQVVTELETEGMVHNVLLYDDLKIHSKIEYTFDESISKWHFVLSPDVYPHIGEVVTLKYKL